VSYDEASELLQKYGSVRKAVDFTSLNNGIPLLFWTLLPFYGSLHSIFYENGSIRSFLVKYFFNSSIFLLIFILFYFFKTDPLGLKPFFILIFNDFQTVMNFIFSLYYQYKHK
jgi:hypothetical protein